MNDREVFRGTDVPFLVLSSANLLAYFFPTSDILPKQFFHIKQ